jgi:hypothetical protein
MWRPDVALLALLVLLLAMGGERLTLGHHNHHHQRHQRGHEQRGQVQAQPVAAGAAALLPGQLEGVQQEPVGERVGALEQIERRPPLKTGAAKRQEIVRPNNTTAARTSSESSANILIKSADEHARVVSDARPARRKRWRDDHEDDDNGGGGDGDKQAAGQARRLQDHQVSALASMSPAPGQTTEAASSASNITSAGAGGARSATNETAGAGADTASNQSQVVLELNAFEAAQMGFFRHTPLVSVILTVAYSMVFIIGIVGNSLVVAIVCKSPRMRTVTNYFIANLALADILVLVFCLPVTLVGNLFIRKYSEDSSLRCVSFRFVNVNPPASQR